jgi:2-polyprenyl-6-methoxyphenol hydroxylase-like FAD-dependent oxidoreductase
MPIVLNELEKVGLYDDVEKAGHKNYEGIIFRKSHAKGGEVLAQLKMSQVPKGAVKYDFAGIHLGQHTLAEIILSHCEKQKNIRFRWNHRFAGAKQSGGSDPVTVTCVGPVGERFFSCEYLVGADGAGSAVRRSLCIPFEGFTWQDFRFVASNVKYDFEELGGFTTANMIVDDEDWAVIARTGPGDAPWRVAFGMRTDIPESEILKQLPGKYERLLPGPRPLKYELVSANPYWAHQRVAKTFKVGKVVLCGDAGHVSLPRTAYMQTDSDFDYSPITLLEVWVSPPVFWTLQHWEIASSGYTTITSLRMLCWNDMRECEGRPGSTSPIPSPLTSSFESILSTPTSRKHETTSFKRSIQIHQCI